MYHVKGGLWENANCNLYGLLLSAEVIEVEVVTTDDTTTTDTEDSTNSVALPAAVGKQVYIIQHKLCSKSISYSTNSTASLYHTAQTL